MKDTLKRFWNDDQGLETAEWAVMAALIVAATVAAIGLVSTAITGRFTALSTTITNGK